MQKKLISFVLPVYNERDNLTVILKELLKYVDAISLRYDYEIIFVNDGSKDASWSIIKNFAQHHPHIKGISFTRNFGHQIALTAGYHYAAGDAIISMDADMQHPPETIPAMIEAWQSGFDIVYVKNVNRNDGFLKKVTAIYYYKFLEFVSDVAIPRNVADFRLIDKKVLNVINRFEEKARYLRGMVAWTGFTYTIIPCNFAKRHAGVPGYTWRKMFKLALDGIIGFSDSPFHYTKIISILIFIVGLLVLLWLIVNTFFFHMHYQLFKWIIASIVCCIGMQLYCIWVLSEHIVSIYSQSKNRPLYITKDTINC